MRARILIFLGLFILLCGATCVRAQDEDPFSPNPRAKKEDPPRSLMEAISKMRIEKEKKDFNEMLRRGDDVVKLAERLDDNAASSQRDRVSEIGKLVKKIRDDLGGDGDDGPDAPPLPASSSDAIRSLKEEVSGLSEELKKATRFTVSAAAIDHANEILRLVKYLRD